VEDIATTAKTRPGFPQMWTAMLEGHTVREDRG
jgi:hypothetical protein